MNQPVRKRMGRPPGAKNKRKSLSADMIAEQCDRAKHNPVGWLIGVANGTNIDYDWTKDDRFKANAKLAELIHGEKRLTVEQQTSEATQYEIVFVNDETTGFELPGEGGAASPENVHGPAPIQRAGVSSQDGQDSIRHQQTDP